MELSVVKNYLNIDKSYIDDDNLIANLIAIAESYVKNYTGIDDYTVHKELELCVLQLVSSSYNNRDYEGEAKLNVSNFVKSILNLHSQNLV